MAGGKHFAVATYISGAKYLPLLVAWLHSVARVYEGSPNVDIVVVHCEVDLSALEQLRACAGANYTGNVSLVPSCIEHPSRGHARFREAVAEDDAVIMRYLRTFGVYALWGLSAYERVLFLDVDVLALRRVPLEDGRRWGGKGAGVQNVHCVRIEKADTCNTGVLVVHPSAQMHGRIMAALSRVHASELLLISDQAFFTTFFSECVSPLPREYNYLAMLGSANWPWRKGLGKAVHFHYRSSLFKPIDLHSGAPRLAYDARRPDRIYAVFHAHFAPMHACYAQAVRRGDAPALLGASARAPRRLGEARAAAARRRWERHVRRMEREARVLVARNASAPGGAPPGDAPPSARGGDGARLPSARALQATRAKPGPAAARARDVATTKLLTEGYARTPTLIDDLRCKKAHRTT